MWFDAAMLRALTVLASLALHALASAQAPPLPAAPPRTVPRLTATISMTPALQALQRDDAQNPGMLWVKAGATAWSTPPDASAPSCANCHGEASVSMRGVAARHPRVVDDDQRAPSVQTLAQRIDRCRIDRQRQLPLPRESKPLLDLEAFVAFQSRGVPIAPQSHGLQDALAIEGGQWFTRRMGQLNLSCAQCHDERAGRSLGGSVIPPGDPTGYPIYRLEWQGVGSLNRRLRACMVGVRADPFAPDSPAWLALEVYLMRRAAGMLIETPAVRP